jgi:hypothetical protein
MPYTFFCHFSLFGYYPANEALIVAKIATKKPGCFRALRSRLRSACGQAAYIDEKEAAALGKKCVRKIKSAGPQQDMPRICTFAPVFTDNRIIQFEK